MADSMELWSFPQGAVGTDETLKGFHVESADGPAGTVAWASYEPGESYLVVTRRHHLREQRHVVPAGAVERIDTANRTLHLSLTRAELDELPAHHGEPAPLERWMSEAVERAIGTRSLGGDMM
jgi:hypothetical protein